MRMRSALAGLASMAILATGAVVATAGGASATVSGNTQGCTPGYWKNHTNVWQEYTAGTTLSHMLRAPINGSDYTFPTSPTDLSGYNNTTMAQALALQGGPGVDGAAQILLRAGTAGVLNAAYDVPGGGGLFYPFRRYSDQTFNGVTYPALIPAIRDALNGEDRDTMLNLASFIDQANNLGCPLNKNGLIGG